MSLARCTLARLGATAGAAGLLISGAAGVASAHVSVTPSTSAAGSYSVLTFSVAHGCEGSPTTAMTISIPEGINAVSPTRNDFYDVTKQTEQLDPPVVDAAGNELTERVSTVTYTARTPLPEGFRDTFEVQLQLPEEAVGESLLFPTIQTCEKGETAWTEVPAEGQTEDDLESPAPGFTIVEAGEAEGGHGAAPAAAPETSSAAQTEASSGDGNSNGLAVAGLAAGVVGLLVGGLALLRTRRTA